MTAAAAEAARDRRAALRLRLGEARERFVASDAGQRAHAALAGHLGAVLAELAPTVLGLYWPLRSEFNAVVPCLADVRLKDVGFALPCARRVPVEMNYRRWDRTTPTVTDECGIPCGEGGPVVPDVVLVPCLGFTREGFRLGYGGGYFDRWLAAQPQVTAMGVAWSMGELTAAEFTPQPHDQPLMVVVTEKGVVAG